MIELDRLLKEFKARGGKVKTIPCGVRGEVVGKSFYARTTVKSRAAKARYEATMYRLHASANLGAYVSAPHGEQMAVDTKIRLMGVA